jgi:hypothetical protein
LKKKQFLEFKGWPSDGRDTQWAMNYQEAAIYLEEGAAAYLVDLAASLLLAQNHPLFRPSNCLFPSICEFGTRSFGSDRFRTDSEVQVVGAEDVIPSC